MVTDAFGETTGLLDEPAASHWAETVEAILSHARSAPDALGRTLAADPLFAQGHATRGILLLTLARAELVSQARLCLDTARAAAARRPISQHEHGYIAALALWLDGDPAGAADVLEGVLSERPRDVLAFKLVQAIRFMIGDIAGMDRIGALALAASSKGSAASGYIRGCQAFALEEMGRFVEAEAMGREAVQLAPRDAWGRHAVAHCFEMTGRAREGVAWLDRSRSWDHCSNFGFHLHWHMALFQLELGDTDAVLALYDNAVRAAPTDDFRDLANAASLLQRLELDGVNVGARWEELAEIAEKRIDDRQLVFADLHYMLALLGADRRNAAQTVAENLVRHSRNAASHDACVAGETGAATAQGLIAFRRGDYAEAARLLRTGEPLRKRAGGSNAQRDVFDQIALESLVRAGEYDRAETLLTQRMAARGGHNLFATSRLHRIVAGRQASARLGALLIAASEPATHH